MAYPSAVIATARASEAIAEIWWLVAWVGFIVAAILGVVATILGTAPRQNRIMAMRISVIGGLISYFPILFTLHVYCIDFVAVGGDGTPASPSFLSVIAPVVAPLIVCLAAGGIAYARLRRTP